MNVLDRILAHKAEELRSAQAQRPPAALAREARDVARPVASLQRSLAG